MSGEKIRPDHWTALAISPAYKALFESEDSPLVAELSKSERLLVAGDEVDPHALGLARGVIRFARLVSPGRIGQIAEADREKENPLSPEKGAQYRAPTRYR